jgi:hypothetical protein
MKLIRYYYFNLNGLKYIIYTTNIMLRCKSQHISLTCSSWETVVSTRKETSLPVFYHNTITD